MKTLSRIAALAILVWAVGSIVAEHGFVRAGEKPSEAHAALHAGLDVAFVLLLAGYVVLLLAVERREDWMRRNRFLLVAALVGVLALFAARGEAFRLAVLGVKSVAALILGFRLALAVPSKLNLTTPLVIAASFLLIITAGWLMLMLPAAAAPDRPPVGSVDALFTATSATCVTGLVVLDTGGDFSTFGQLVILILIQIGGLGLMTFVAFFSFAAGAGLPLREQAMMREALSLHSLSHLGNVLRFIVVSTFLLEALGAVIIYLSFPFPANWSAGYSVYFSVFHAISAFCNAGFSLLTRSITCAVGSVPVNLIFMSLILLGGFGFAVNQRIAWHAGRLFGRGRRPGPPFRVHTRIALVVSLILVVVGGAAIYTLELNNDAFGAVETAAGETAPGGQKERVLASLFQSVSARTAGFNTTEVGALSSATLLLIILLMFVGASPGGTGGGVKTTTFALFWLAIISRLRNRERVESFKRTIPRALIETALVIIIAAALVVTASAFAVSLFGVHWDRMDAATLANVEGRHFECILFEVTSAFATVGYSTGITKYLSTGAKMAVTLAMFIGRIGPFTLLLAMSRQAGKARYRYPEEGIIVG